MRRPVHFWGGALGALIALDIWTAYNDVEGDSLSEVVRSTFRTETPAGRTVVVVGWTVLTVWVVPHWCRRVVDAAP